MRLKIFISALTIFFFFGLLTVKAQAADLLFGKSSTEVHANADGSANVSQVIVIKNTSTFEVITAVNFEIPLKFENLSVSIRGLPHSVEVTDNYALVNLSDNPVRFKEETVMIINYRLNKLFARQEAIKSIFLPKTALTNSTSEDSLRIYLPLTFGELAYLNRKPISVTEENGQHVINFSGLDEVYLVLANYNAVKLNTLWKAVNNKNESIKVRVPLPGSENNPVVFTEIKGFQDGMRDQNTNEFLLLDVSGKTEQTASYQGIIKKYDYKQFRFPAENKTDDWYYAGLDKIKQASGSSIHEVYKFVLNSLHPVFPDTNWQRRSPEDAMLASKHTSLDYANMLTGLYRNQGLTAQVVYGLVRLPITGQFVWHFWVAYEKEGQWLFQDPFLEDYLNFDMESGVTPDRLVFDVLTDNDPAAALGLNYLENYASPLEFFNDTNDSIQLQGEYEITLENLSRAYSAHNLDLRLYIKNNSNHNIYLDKVQIENVSLDQEALRSFLILPQTNKMIQLPGVLIGNIFTQGSANIGGLVAVRYAREEQEQKVGTEVMLGIDYPLIFISILVIIIAAAIILGYGFKLI